MQFSSSEKVRSISCSWDDKTSSTTGSFPLRFPKLQQKVGTKSYSTRLTRNVCKNVSPRSTDLFCSLCWNDSARSPLPATTTQLFFQSLSSHTLCSCLELLSTTNNLRSFWQCNFQQVSPNVFCSWDDSFTLKRKSSSPNNLCMCTDSPSTLSTNTSIEWNLYMS